MLCAMKAHVDASRTTEEDRTLDTFAQEAKVLGTPGHPLGCRTFLDPPVGVLPPSPALAGRHFIDVRRDDPTPRWWGIND